MSNGAGGSGRHDPARRPLPGDRARDIARAFLPDWPLGNRYHYYYARAKLRSDPLYPGVCEALRGTRAPVLDLGCGIGLLAHALQQDGIGVRYFGVDNDARKIVSARRAAARAGLVDALAGMLEPGARLVIRTGLDDGSRRARVTRAGDRLARALRWMNASPRHYPEAEMLRARFEAGGLHSEFIPLYGDTPFNNWRIVAWRE